MTLPTFAAVIADVLDLGPAHGIGGATRLCEDLATDSLDRQCIAVDCVDARLPRCLRSLARRTRLSSITRRR